MDIDVTVVEGDITLPDSDATTPPVPALSADNLYTAAQKERILNDWRHFVTHGFQQQDFTPALYRLLHRYCALPDCGGQANFWQDFFNKDAGTLLRVIKQFSTSGKNAVYDTHDWLYSAPKDLKQEMCATMTPLAPAYTSLLTGLTAQHEDMLPRWQALADSAGLPHQTTPAGYPVGDNTRQLLAQAASVAPRRPISGLQLMLPILEEPNVQAKTT